MALFAKSRLSSGEMIRLMGEAIEKAERGDEPTNLDC